MEKVYEKYNVLNIIKEMMSTMIQKVYENIASLTSLIKIYTYTIEI